MRMREYGEADLIYERVNDEEFVYEILFFINKIYRDADGRLWLTRTWVNESEQDKDVLQIYYIYCG
jgi:hypothetical protein